MVRQSLTGDLGVDVHLGSPVAGVDTARRQVRLADGTVLPYDDVVVTTGMTARVLPDADPARHTNVHVLRTYDDAARLRTALGATDRLAVVGAGFIGSEVASGAVAAGLSVTVIDPMPVPLHRSLGPVPGTDLAARQRASGVVLRTGVGVSGVRANADGGRVEALELSDGSRLEVDEVLLGLGGVPATDVLTNTPVTVARGVVTDEYGRTDVEGVWAAGDVAESFHRGYGRHLQVEHWFNAHEQATVVADNLLATDDDALTAHAPVPYFWSHQHGVHLQVLGTTEADGEPRRLETPNGKGSVLLYTTGSTLVGVVTLNAAPVLMKLRPLVARQAPVGEAVDLIG
ncbi:FAD/NAD(P)-binding oxidoreductase [Jatrophihabitans fulvus]